ncbi:hypothetical protein T484DRAFT_1833900 [Baffinella frigidus]|nr:hypothetical protein T484DRAFT_1833900 [Cryptophyta sp. CCMP2293]
MRLTLDLGGVLGAFFFTLAFGLLFPTIVVALVYEKEMHLRVMMRMMGLGSAAYWIINYAFWLLMYSMYILFMVAVASGVSLPSAHCVGYSLYILFMASGVSLPSGYTIGLFTKTEASVHFVNFFLFANYVIALSFLWSNPEP